MADHTEIDDTHLHGASPAVDISVTEKAASKANNVITRLRYYPAEPTDYNLLEIQISGRMTCSSSSQRERTGFHN